MSNFSLHDIIGSAIAVLLFSLVYVSPGYVTGWLFDLFDFRKRLPATRFVIAIVLSIAISSIITFLSWNLLSVKATFIVLAAFGIAFIYLLFQTKRIAVSDEIKRLQRMAVYIAAAWCALSILFLIDIQWGGHLYYNVISFDFTTRVAVINAMTRSGVPPINPSYFPGHPVRLTFLYYFWYIPCSLVAQIGSPWVDGRAAMIASVAWCGIGVMAVIALYLRLRNADSGAKAWRSGLIGGGLLLVSGLDFIPALFLLVTTRIRNGSSYILGDIEHWNEQITAWVGAISWVPHHVAAMLACLTGMMLVLSIREQGLWKKISAMFVAGLAFASAFGLSVYVTLVFIIFWAGWMLVLFLQKERQLSLTMALAGIVALFAASPFIIGLLRGGLGASGGFPIAFAVREFRPIGGLVANLNPIISNLIYLLLLPLSYMMELGFFFVTGLLWFQQHDKGRWQKNPFQLAEVLLFSTTFLVGSFVRSTSIANNDLGWRVWLFGQFILLTWSVEVITKYFANSSKETTVQIKKTGRQLMLLLLLGFTTTIVDVSLLRTWTILVDKGIPGFPNGYSPDTKFGERTFAARTTYEYINAILPENIHVQHDPADVLNVPVGLYLNRPMVIAGQTAYGVSPSEFDKRTATTAEIFLANSSWDQIDSSCKRDFIDVIVVNDADPLWDKLKILEQERKPVYKNSYYAVFTCGNFNKTFVSP